jgi:glutamate dehydrogenase/leucine dehydrogenase
VRRLVEQSPEKFAAQLRAADRRRGYVIRDPETGAYHPSHPVLDEIAQHLSAAPDCDAHEAVFFELGPATGALFGAFLHRTTRGQSQGGLRHWPYSEMEAFVRDGLRLARGMSRKSALAGLWWGGGKGLIARQPGGAHLQPAYRRRLYREYGAFVSSLRGCYITAVDVGTTPLDMAAVFRATRFATSVPEEVGGTGNPSPWTAAGVVCAMEAALEFLGLGSLAGKTIAMQGTGSVGSAMIPMLLNKGVARIVASEICAEQRAALESAFDGQPVDLRAARPGDREILAEPCDILAPNALGGVLDAKSMASIRARVVCGAANNPLVDGDRGDRALAARGITYVPDFVANRMGIVACANEQYGSIGDDPTIRRHLDPECPIGIHATVLRVLELARGSDITPLEAANRLADELAEQPHPVWGPRGREIVASLVADGWDRHSTP